VIRDVYELRAAREPLRMTLMTCREPDVDKPGTVVLGPSSVSPGARSAELSYDADLFAARSEPIAIADPQLRSSWGTRIWRIVLTAKQSDLKHESVLRIREHR
jgi:hypothetical protein